MNGLVIYGVPLVVTLAAFLIYAQRRTVLAWVLVKREFVSTLRGGRAILLVLFFTTLSALWVLTSWPSNYEGMGHSLEMAGWLSRDLMRTFSVGLLVGMSTMLRSAIKANRRALEETKAKAAGDDRPEDED